MNKNPACPRCQSDAVVKNGNILGKQRFKCKACNRQFTRLTPRGRPASEKASAVTLYAQGLSMCAIARLFHVSPSAVLKWIRNFAREHYEKPVPTSSIEVELDEMWHYLKSKKTNSGSGKPYPDKQAGSLTGNAETGMLSRSKD